MQNKIGKWKTMQAMNQKLRKYKSEDEIIIPKHFHAEIH
jgi:hypothetical protein